MLKSITLPLTPFAQNTRLLFDSEGQELVVIDPGGEVPQILERINGLDRRCMAVWLTHSHLDHCGGVADLLAETGAKLYAHSGEAFMREAVLEICEMYGLPAGEMKNCPEPEQYIAEGDKLSIEGHEFEVLFTPGHSPGHVCFYNKSDNLLIAGDTLFSGSIGRTDLPGGDHATLMSSIKHKIMTLPDDTRVLPGHGPETTVGTERESNPFLTGAFDG